MYVQVPTARLPLPACQHFCRISIAFAKVAPATRDCDTRRRGGTQGRYYQGRPILIEFSPVTDFREATCRQYEENTCTRGGYCNFMHLRPISRDLRKQLFGRYKRREPERDDRRGSPPASCLLLPAPCFLRPAHAAVWPRPAPRA